MRILVAIAVLLGAIEVASAQTTTISGTVRDLNGAPLEKLSDFQVNAFSGNKAIASGTVSSAAPFVYTINIPTGLVNPADVRILLVYSATGRDTVSLNSIVGKASVVQNGQDVGKDSSPGPAATKSLRWQGLRPESRHSIRRPGVSWPDWFCRDVV